MIKREKHNMNRALELLRDIRSRQEKRAAQLKGYEAVSLKCRVHQSGKIYYYKRNDSGGKATYLGGVNCEKVRLIKEAHYLKRSLSLIDEDIRILEKAAVRLKEIRYEDVNDMLPGVYKGAAVDYAAADEKRRMWKENALAYKNSFSVYRPEELKIPTNDGNKVRSRTEGYIYNLLLDLGVCFVYEMPVRVGSRIFWADFVILSEIDDETEIIIEHQGMMNDRGYRERFNDKLYGYWKAGFIPGINIFYTFDLPNGGLDLTPIHDIVRNHVRCCS